MTNGSHKGQNNASDIGQHANDAYVNYCGDSHYCNAFAGAAIQFNKVTLSVISMVFQMLIMGALLLNAIFLIRIEQKGIPKR